MRYVATFIFVLLGLISPATAGVDGGTQSPFALGAGARSLALGGADMATGEEAAAPFWNAARLAWAEQYAVSGFHSSLYGSDVAYQYLGIVAPTTDFGVFGLGVFRLGVDGIERRDASNVFLGNFDDSRLQFIVAYGRTVSGYDVGAAITLERHSIDNYSATSSPAVNLSAGRRFHPGWSRVPAIAVAFQVRNAVKPSIELATESVRYPTVGDVGVSAEIKPMAGRDQTITVSGALDKAEAVSARLAAGVEYDFEKMLAVRAGIRDSKLSFGVGLAYAGFAFDYALVDRDLGSIHTFTLTSRFGTPVSERLLEREKKREAEFNQLMAERLVARNRAMVDGLIEQAGQETAAGDLEAAAGHYDRALFLARSGGMDTLSIQSRAAEVRRRIEEVRRAERFAAYVDSSRTRMNRQDYVAARYFAGLAKQEMPGSPQAVALYARADSAIEITSSREQVIGTQLLAVDSMLAYGLVDDAYTTVQSLNQLAPDDRRVQQAVRKVRFERWMQRASSANARSDREGALLALDSALALYPGHQWCLAMKNQILSQPQTKAIVAPPPVRPTALSEEMRREVEQDYEAARDYFRSGDLTNAIEYWERVERLAPDYENVRDYLVKAYKFVGVEQYGQNHLREAVDTWRKAARLQPGNEEIAGYIKRTESEIRKLQELSYEHE